MDNTGLIDFEVSDFSGGMTDFYVGGERNQFERADNLYITSMRRLYTRPGFTPYVNYRVTSTEIIRNIIEHQLSVLVRGGNKLWFLGESNATEVLKPNLSSVFSLNSNSSRVMSSYWNGHTLLTTDALETPKKVFKDSTGVFRAQAAGLPDALLIYATKLANEVRTKFSAHCMNTTQHLAADAGSIAISPLAYTEDALIALVNSLTKNYTEHMTRSGIHTGVPTNNLASTSQVTGLTGAIDRLKDIKLKFNAHDANASVHNAINLNQVTTKIDTELFSFTSGGGNTYGYAVHFINRYNVEDVGFIERSSIAYGLISNANSPNVNPVTITLPQITSSYDGYDISNIQIAVFRTKNGGSTFYKIGEVVNGTATFVDNFADSSIETNETLYVEGGGVEDEGAPRAKFNLVIGDIAYLAHVYDGPTLRKNRLIQGKPGTISSFPGGNYCDFEADIVGVGAAGGLPIVFLSNRRIYRVDGRFTVNSQGGMFKKLITNRVSSVNQEGIVSTTDGVFFAGDDGFYFTDGFTLKKVSPDLPQTYIALSSKTDIIATYDNLLEMVYWSVKRDSSQTYNDVIFVAHAKFRSPLDGLPFTVYSGGNSPLNFQNTALLVLGGKLLRADPRGYILKHDDTRTVDSFIDVNTSPLNWATQTIIYDYRSAAYDFGNSQVRKWVSKLCLNAENTTSLSLQPSSNNDNSGVFVDIDSINKQGLPEWGDPTVIWGGDGPSWNYAPAIIEWRYMPLAKQAGRCMYKQVRLTNDYILVDDSVSAGKCIVDAPTKTVTLQNYPLKSWLPSAVNYYLSFSTDNYQKEYLVIGLSGGVITVSNSADTLVSDPNAEWKMRGYKKNEVLNMLNYVLNYKIISMTQDKAVVSA